MPPAVGVIFHAHAAACPAEVQCQGIDTNATIDLLEAAAANIDGVIAIASGQDVIALAVGEIDGIVARTCGQGEVLDAARDGCCTDKRAISGCRHVECQSCGGVGIVTHPGVIAVATIDDVGTAITIKQVIAIVACQLVGLISAIEPVVATATRQDVLFVVDEVYEAVPSASP